MSSSHTRDFIPRRDAEFHAWFGNLTTYVKERALSSGPPPLWTHIPQAKTHELILRNDTWNGFHIKLFGPHTDVDVQNKQRERVLDEAFLRPFVKQYLKFDPVTDADRTAMQVHGNEYHRGHSGRITEMVHAESDSSVIRQIIWRYWIKGSEHHAKPDHCYGVECAYARLDHPPTSIYELSRREISTASPLELKFDEAERGGKVYCCFRWLGTKEGNQGDWSEIFSAVIP